NALILIDSGGYEPASGNSRPIAFRAAHWPGVPEIMVRIDPRSFAAEGGTKSYGAPGRIRPETIDRYYELTLRPGNREAFVDRMRTPYVDETPRLRTLSLPTLVMWGGAHTVMS